MDHSPVKDALLEASRPAPIVSLPQFCSEFEVIIPHKCHSTGTLIALGANKIVMTKQATLGPIDPSVNTPLNPHVEGAPPDARVSKPCMTTSGANFASIRPLIVRRIWVKINRRIIR